MTTLRSIKSVPYFALDPSCVLYLPLSELDGASFASKDAYGHLATVTEALWRLLGRWFDKINGSITCGSDTSLDNIFDDGGGTAIAWVNPGSDGEGTNARIFSKSVGWDFAVAAEAAGKVKFELLQAFSGDNGSWRTTATQLVINTWAMVAVTYDNGDVANNPILYVNDAVVANTEIGTPTGTRTSDAASTLYIGNNSSGTATWDNLIGECWLLRRILTPLEIQQNYLRTKSRYA